MAFAKKKKKKERNSKDPFETVGIFTDCMELVDENTASIKKRQITCYVNKP